MQIYGELETLPELYSDSATTIGVFDGVHLGHQMIINKTIDLAKSINGSSVVITFDHHPLSIVHPEYAPPTLTAIDLKVDYIAQLGVDIVIVIPFTQEIANIEPNAFVDEILVEKLHSKYLVIGEDFSFGKDRKGSIDFLQTYAGAKGIKTQVIPHLKKDGIVISSTEIRKRLRLGDIEGVYELEGRYPKFRGEIVHGFGRGKSSIGIPTANVELSHDELLPANGVYAGFARIGKESLPCVADIGVSPTFGDVADAEIQVHIIDYENNLYGYSIEVELIKKLRGEKQFPSVDVLKAQILADIERARLELSHIVHLD